MCGVCGVYGVDSVDGVDGVDGWCGWLIRFRVNSSRSARLRLMNLAPRDFIFVYGLSLCIRVIGWCVCVVSVQRTVVVCVCV